MVHVPHLFEFSVLLLNFGGYALVRWLDGRHLEARFKSYHEDLAGFENRLREDFSSHIQTAKNQLAGMDRRVCIECKRLHTKFELTPKGALCAGCGGKVE